jgi:hypothetical protein
METELDNSRQNQPASHSISTYTHSPRERKRACKGVQLSLNISQKRYLLDISIKISFDSRDKTSKNRPEKPLSPLLYNYYKQA